MKSVVFLLFLLGITLLSAGQLTFPWALESQNQGTSFTDMVVDAKGNCLITGLFTRELSFGDKTIFTDEDNIICDNENVTITTNTDQAMFIAKFSSAGECIWLNKVEVKDMEWFDPLIEVDASGDVYMACSFLGAIACGETVLMATDTQGYDGTDIFIGKLIGNGKWLWAKRFGDHHRDIIEEFQVDTDDNIYLLRDYWLTDELTEYLPVVEKISAKGDVLWSNEPIQAAPQSIGSTMFFVLSNEAEPILILPFFYDIKVGTKQYQSGNTGKLVIVKYTATGQINGSYVVENDLRIDNHEDSIDLYDHDVDDVAFDDSGNVYICGDRLIPETDSRDSYRMFYFVKADVSGKILWEKTFNTDETQGADLSINKICVDSKANIYLTGGFNKSAVFANIKLTSNSPLATAYIANCDKNGIWQWSYSLPNQSKSEIAQMSIGKDNSVYVCGSYSQQITLGDKIFTSNKRYNENRFIAKMIAK